jgi:hypothetical protein
VYLCQKNYWIKIQKLCEGKGLTGKGINRWLPWILAAMVLASGCSGVLMQSKDSNGQTERVKLNTMGTWSDYGIRPRDHTSRNDNPNDNMGVMLMKESTF